MCTFSSSYLLYTNFNKILSVNEIYFSVCSLDMMYIEDYRPNNKCTDKILLKLVMVKVQENPYFTIDSYRKELIVFLILVVKI